jgi:large subunit ribosomal protein L10
MKREPAQWKVELVKELSKEIEKSPVSALVSIKGIRNAQLQKIRADLKGRVKIRVVRKRLLLKALDKVKLENIKDFGSMAEGQIAVVTAEEAPTKLYRMFENTKQKAAARGGEIAEDDIIVPEMPTNFPPGPMISEFQKAGLQTAIEKGKIVIKKETLYVKKGEAIPKDKAKILEKLEILPVTVGLNMIGAYEAGLVFNKEAVSITEEQLLGDITRAFSQAKNLALETLFLVPEIVPQLIVKARLYAEQLALETGTVDESNVQLFILKAIREANALSQAVSGESPEEDQGSEETTQDSAASEESKQDDEDKASEGLSALFG